MLNAELLRKNLQKSLKNNRNQKLFIVGAGVATLVASGGTGPGGGTGPQNVATSKLVATSQVNGTVSHNDDVITLTGGGIVAAGDGNDKITGSDAQDIIGGGRGIDIITGGAGLDAFVVVGVTENASYTSEYLFELGGTGLDLSEFFNLADINNHSVSDVQAGESIDGGADGGYIFALGDVNFSGVTLANINKIFLDGEFIISNSTLQTLVEQGLDELFGTGVIRAESGMLDLDDVIVPKSITIKDSSGNIVFPRPTTDSIGSEINVAENSTIVGVYNVTDASAVGDVKYTLEGADANLFTIDEDTGEIAFVSPPTIGNAQDAGADNVYNIRIIATDQHTNSFYDVAITVVDAGNVQNTGEVSITGVPVQGETLSATVSDLDGINGITINYQWFKDGAEISGATNDAYQLTVDDVDAIMTVRATYTDEASQVENVTSDPTNPVIGTVVTATNSLGQVSIIGPATQGQTLTALVADADGLLGATISYQWQLNGADILNANDSTYVPTLVDIGGSITVKASYTDQGDSAEFLTSEATDAVIAAVVNVNFAGSIEMSGVASQGQTLTAEITDLDGLGGVDISYQWLKDGEAIIDATANIYELTATDVDGLISVRATYTDEGNNDESLTSGVTTPVTGIIVTNNNIVGSVTIDGVATQGEILTAVVVDDDGFFGATINYQWQRGGVDIVGANDGTYELVQADVGATILVSVSYIDQLGSSEFLTSDATTAVINVNDIGIVTIVGDILQGETIAASVADEDGIFGVTISYQWKLDGVNIVGATNGIYELTQADVGKVITVLASYTDEFGHTEIITSAPSIPVVNLNEAPELTIDTSVSVEENKILVATIAATDNDGDTLTYTHTGVDADKFLLDSATGALTFKAPTDFEFFDDVGGDGTYNVTVTATDGEGLFDTQDLAIQLTDVANELTPTLNVMNEYTRVGGEFLVNTIVERDQDYPTMTMLKGGGYAIAWKTDLDLPNAYDGISAQVYDADHNRVGVEIAVDIILEAEYESPSIAALDDGGFVLTWTSYNNDSSYDIHAQMFNADGTKNGDFVLVNEFTEDGQEYSSVTGLDNGGYLVTWYTEDELTGDGEDTAIKARIYNPEIGAFEPEFLVNTRFDDEQENPDVINLAGGGYVFAWESEDGDEDDISYAVAARIFDANGIGADAEITLNTLYERGQTEVSLAALTGGGFVAVWQTNEEDEYTFQKGDIKGRVFDETGQGIADEFFINATVSNRQREPEVTALADGGFAVTWDDKNKLGFDNQKSIKMQVFNAVGEARGSEILVNTQYLDDQEAPEISELANGDLVVSWNTEFGDLALFGGDDTIVAQAFEYAPIYKYEEGTSTAFNILALAHFEHEEGTLSQVTIKNIGSGVSFNHGILDGNTLTLTPADLVGLEITTISDLNKQFEMQIEALFIGSESQYLVKNIVPVSVGVFVEGGENNDTEVLTKFNDHIDGGLGFDTLTLEGNFGDYEFQMLGNDLVINSGEELDFVHSIEIFEFANTTVNAENLLDEGLIEGISETDYKIWLRGDYEYSPFNVKSASNDNDLNLADTEQREKIDGLGGTDIYILDGVVANYEFHVVGDGIEVTRKAAGLDDIDIIHSYEILNFTESGEDVAVETILELELLKGGNGFSDFSTLEFAEWLANDYNFNVL